MRVGQTNRHGEKLVGYAVYRAADGCDEEYYGRVTSLRAARRLAANSSPTPKWMYDTHRAARDGVATPSLDENEREGEASDWFGPGGCNCACPIFNRPLFKGV